MRALAIWMEARESDMDCEYGGYYVTVNTVDLSANRDDVFAVCSLLLKSKVPNKHTVLRKYLVTQRFSLLWFAKLYK